MTTRGRARAGAVAVGMLLLVSGCGGATSPGERIDGVVATASSRASAAADRAAEAVRSTARAVDSEPPDDLADEVRVDEPLVADARFVEREDVTALRVVPEQRLRDETAQAVHAEAWRRVVAAVPEADTPGMRDQFLCHAMFAPTKDAWYLEPARPAVGYWGTVTAGCNPGDVMDVG